MFKTVSVWISVPNYTFKCTCKSIHKLYPVFVIVDYYGEEKKRMRSKWGLDDYTRSSAQRRARVIYHEWIYTNFKGIVQIK